MENCREFPGAVVSRQSHAARHASRADPGRPVAGGTRTAAGNRHARDSALHYAPYRPRHDCKTLFGFSTDARQDSGRGDEVSLDRTIGKEVWS